MAKLSRTSPGYRGVIFATGTADGKFFSVVATSSPGDLLHTNDRGARLESIRLDAWNISAANVDLTVQWIGTASTDALTYTIPARGGPVSVIPDWKLPRGSSIRVYAGTTAVISAYLEATEVD